jgi:hypothetical protein
MSMSRTVVMVLLLAAMGLGCAARYDPARPPWPYARVTGLNDVPPPLRGAPLFAGRWLVADPVGETVLSETTDPRFLIRFSFEVPRTFTFVDLGPGAEVENLVFQEAGRTALLVGAITSPHHGQAVVARSILFLDLEQILLLDAVPLGRDGFARGLAVDPYKNRVFLLNDDGQGRGAVHRVDLFDGTRLETPTGVIPSGLGRKGLVLDRDIRRVFCLAGGMPARSDFAPVTGIEPQEPQLLVLDPDSLAVRSRLPLGPRQEPRALAYDESRDRVCILVTERNRSRLLVVDAAFVEKRGDVLLPEETTDLVLSGSYAIMPGAHGIYVVDLDIESLVSRLALPLDLTGEMVVSGDRTSVMVAFQSAGVANAPGLAHIALQSGDLLDILR